MSLEDWLNDKLVVKHRPSAREIAELLHICDRDLEKTGISELGPDWRLSIAHNAAVQAARAALAAVGYRARKCLLCADNIYHSSGVIMRMLNQPEDTVSICPPGNSS
jgi:hypothetical protein